MSGVEPWQVGLTFVGTIVGSVLLFMGARFTARKSSEGVNRKTDVDAQQSALDAWQELMDPYREEVKMLRTELREERDDRARTEQRVEADRLAAKKMVDEQVTRLTERIDLLTIQLTEWKRAARTIARWATLLRDEVLRLGGTVPTTPEELLTLQAIEEHDRP